MRKRIGKVKWRKRRTLQGFRGYFSPRHKRAVTKKATGKSTLYNCVLMSRHYSLKRKLSFYSSLIQKCGV